MLDDRQNRILTDTDPGSPMGDLMRRYWQPIAAVSDLDDNPIKPIRLMGEDLALYKDLGGNYGLIDRHCLHRGADLTYGFVEECGLRCNYHGWLFDHSGACTAQPFEDTAGPDSGFKDKFKIKAYPVEALAGLIWAYLGPEPAPLVPNWEPFTWKNGFVQIVFTEIPCNWFQCQENSIDPIHFEWMHDNWKTRLEGKTGPYSPTHLKIEFEEFEYGFTYHRVREGADESGPLWTIGRVCLWPNSLFTGGHFEWRVPIDNGNTLSVGWFFNHVPKEREPFVQNRIPSWESPLVDPETGRWISSHIMNQDFIAWVGQGRLTDRGREHLGRSDRGIVMIRQRFFDDMKRIENGEEPKSIIRDARTNACIELPIIGRELLRDGMTMEELADAEKADTAPPQRRFVFQAGQPAEVRRAYEDAMGFKLEDRGFVEQPSG